MEPTKLNIGSGSEGDLQEGWINVDIIKGPGVDLVADCRKIPLREGSVDAIRTYHMVEHLTKPELAEFADEWGSWQAKGMDQHSVVADPLFVDAKADDYRLRDESPALKLGFKPIPFEKIGPYNDELRASWPIVEVPGARETQS